MPYIDTHCHLSDSAFNEDREEIIETALLLGVEFFFEILCSPNEWEKDFLFSNYLKKFYFAWGIHPEYASKYKIEDLQNLEEKLKKEKTLFIGEIGLDYYWVNDNKQKQKDLLLAQLLLSENFSLPCVFHCRNGKSNNDNAYSDLLDLIEKNWRYAPCGKKRGILHSFSGCDIDAKRALELGLYLGINGTFTYPKNRQLREIVKKAGIKNIVFETDSPYLPPQNFRGKRNDPSKLAQIAADVSAYCGFSFHLAQVECYNNSLSFVK